MKHLPTSGWGEAGSQGNPLFALSQEGEHGRLDGRRGAVAAISPVNAGLPGTRSAITVRRDWSRKKTRSRPRKAIPAASSPAFPRTNQPARQARFARTGPWKTATTINATPAPGRATPPSQTQRRAQSGAHPQRPPGPHPLRARPAFGTLLRALPPPPHLALRLILKASPVL